MQEKLNTVLEFIGWQFEKVVTPMTEPFVIGAIIGFGFVASFLCGVLITIGVWVR